MFAIELQTGIFTALSISELIYDLRLCVCQNSIMEAKKKNKRISKIRAEIFPWNGNRISNFCTELETFRSVISAALRVFGTASLCNQCHVLTPQFFTKKLRTLKKCW